MMETTFSHCKYGYETTLHVGQKVECVYYGEWDRKDTYQRSCWSRIIDKPFRPVKLGVIVKDAGIHPYWLGGNEQYLFVKFKEYIFAKPIPISCIKDAAESAQKLESFLNQFKHRLGENGWSYESFDKLKTRIINAKQFTTNDKRA